MLLERIESLVEDLVEGAFGLILRGKIQPLEIARCLTREAEEQKIITLNRIFVPNRYTVGLHPDDMAQLAPIAVELEAEFQRFIGEWVMDRDYAVSGPIRVSLTGQERVRRGRMKIETAVDDLRAAEQAAQKRMGFALQVLADETNACLEVEEGPDLYRAFTLLPRSMTVGTAATCHVRLHDPELPAEYAVIEPESDSWRIEQLDDGPPIRINGTDDHDGLLRDGDRLELGDSVLRFHLARTRERVLTDAD